MKVTTSFDYPPIPTRDMDWSAIDADTYDADCDQDGFFSTSPVGRGRTEAEAIADLMEQLAEREADEHAPDPDQEWLDQMAFERDHSVGRS